MKNKTIKLNIVGDYFGTEKGQTGYNVHVRNLANAINNLDNVEVCMTTFHLPQNWQLQLSDEELLMFKRPRDECNINLYIMLPNQAKVHLCENKKNILFCVWEGSHVLQSWIDIFLDERVHQIWTPSEHVEDAIVNSLKGEEGAHQVDELFNKLKIVPHGIDSNVFKKLDIPKTNKFTFMINSGWVSSWNDRKGVSHALKSFCEEFSMDDDIQMNVKVNGAYGCNLDANLKDLDIQNKNPPKVNVYLEYLDTKQLVELYNESDVFVSTTKAEGFNLGCLEAMGCGLPVLTSDFGGMTDFCNNENGWILNEGKMFDVTFDSNYEGVQWKEPNINEIRTTMRYIYNNRDEVKSKGLRALEDSKKWTWARSAEIAYDCLKEI